MLLSGAECEELVLCRAAGRWLLGEQQALEGGELGDCVKGCL